MHFIDNEHERKINWRKKEMENINNNIQTKENNIKEQTKESTCLKNDYQEKMILESIKRLKNPFVNITVQDVAKDLKIGENMAYAIFKREDFPSVNIGRSWKICLISYILWKTQKRV